MIFDMLIYISYINKYLPRDGIRVQTEVGQPSVDDFLIWICALSKELH